MSGDKKIFDFIREGGWNSSYTFHYQCAWQYFFEFEKHINQLSIKEEFLRNIIKAPSEHIEDLIANETALIHNDAHRAASSAHLYSCLAIEGFLNFYGTVRFREEKYMQQIERLSIGKKLSKIYSLCFQRTLEKTSVLYLSICHIFNQRNELVHPKTREITKMNINDFEYTHPSKLEIKQTIETLELFITDICTMDNNITREFHFRKLQ